MLSELLSFGKDLVDGWLKDLQLLACQDLGKNEDIAETELDLGSDWMACSLA